MPFAERPLGVEGADLVREANSQEAKSRKKIPILAFKAGQHKLMGQGDCETKRGVNPHGSGVPYHGMH